MTTLTGIKRVEVLLQNAAEMEWVENYVYGNAEITEIFNAWLDEKESLNMNTLKDFVDALVTLEIDNFSFGFTIVECLNDKAQEISLDGKIGHSDLITILTNDIKYEVIQHTDIDCEDTTFQVNFTLTTEQELLFRTLGIFNRFGYLPNQVAYITCNYSDID